MLNGILLVDKPEGCTSHDVVARIRRALGTKSVGHCGTLDPMASGLLILLIGSATKLSDFLLQQNKVYRTRIQFGVETDSFDMTGNILKTVDVDVNEDQIKEALEGHLGPLKLPVPQFSAVKVQGKKLYEYARKGVAVEAPEKTMEFFDLKIHEISREGVEVTIGCTKGSYIRAWGHAIGQSLKVGGALSQLRRLESSPWSVDRALELVDVERLTSTEAKENWCEAFGSGFVSAVHALPHLKLLLADSKEERLIENGQIPRSVSTRLVHEVKEAIAEGVSRAIRLASKDSQRLLAILEATPDKGLKIRRVFKA